MQFQLLFSNGEYVNLAIDDNPIGLAYQKIYKHLSRVPIPFKPWDNPYYFKHCSQAELTRDLKTFASRVSVEIDESKCLAQDSEYLNYLHKIYEEGYNGDPAWLDFHEHIHLCDSYQPDIMSLILDYREKSGLLEQKMNPDWFDLVTTKIKAGDVYVAWAELGKTPWSYWQTLEPNDIKRICELAKPWLILRPKIYIALEDMDVLGKGSIEEFYSWWSQYRSEWEKYHNISNWTLEKMTGVLKFGTTVDYKKISDNLLNKHYPVKINCVN